MKPANRLMTPNLLLLWQGLTVSQLGNQAFGIAVIFWLKHTTGSASLMGLIAMLSGLPTVLLGPIAGAVADRFPRREILVVSDIVSGLATAYLGFAMATGSFSANGMLVVVAAVSLVLGITEAFYLPAFTAAVPDVVHEDKLNAANSVVQASVRGSELLGTAISGTLFRVLGAPVLMLFDAASFLYSAICECLTTIPRVKRESKGSTVSALRADTIEGLRYIWRQAGLRRLVFGSSILNALAMPVILLLPFYVEDTLKVKPDWYGFLVAAYGGGTLAGYLLAGALNLSGAARAKTMMLFMVIEGAGPAALAAIRNPGLALVVVFAAGVVGGFVSVGVTFVLQITTAQEMRGRVFGVLATIAGSISPLAMGVSGLIADLLGRNIPLMFLLCGGAIVAVALLLSGSGPFREYLATERPAEVAAGGIS